MTSGSAPDSSSPVRDVSWASCTSCSTAPTAGCTRRTGSSPASTGGSCPWKTEHVLGIAVALILGVSPGLTPAEARARLAELSPLAVVDRSQPDRPQYRLRFDPANFRAVVPVGRGQVFDGRRVWRVFRFDGQAYDQLTAGSYHFTFTFTPARAGGHVSSLRGPPPST